MKRCHGSCWLSGVSVRQETEPHGGSVRWCACYHIVEINRRQDPKETFKYEMTQNLVYRHRNETENIPHLIAGHDLDRHAPTVAFYYTNYLCICIIIIQLNYLWMFTKENTFHSQWRMILENMLNDINLIITLIAIYRWSSSQHIN